ncbi:hypothetical protein NUW58_g3634 [Xylaria curta]|uniref:Uncharacterized protein n=1 Tax=Xylaria curta TaxID=42375 RepID=A0ACC1PA25_9PEZI|nr:hypothetical protein NUW58_g3634 [Xylaria curta]
MATSIDSFGGLGASMLADITATIVRRFQEEHLYQFIRLRDGLLRLEHSDDTDIYRILHRELLGRMDEMWDGVRQALRSELPSTLDQLFGSLKPDFQEAGRLPASYRHPTLTPPRASSDAQAATSFVSEPPIAQSPPKPMITSPVGISARSPTLAPNVAVVEKDTKPKATFDPEIHVIDSADEHSNKRASDPHEPATRPLKKKARKTLEMYDWTFCDKPPIKKNMSLRAAEPEECIFSFGDYPGVYVLRCKLTKCKKRLGRDGPIIFTSHPFKGDGLALAHFEGEGHNIQDEEEIFRKYAIRVNDGSAECNTTKRGDSVFGSSSSEEDIPPRLTSPKKPRDKGKKPERPYDLNIPRTALAETSASASGPNTNESFKDSFYRAGPLKSMSGVTLATDDDVEVPFEARRLELAGE